MKKFSWATTALLFVWSGIVIYFYFRYNSFLIFPEVLQNGVIPSRIFIGIDLIKGFLIFSFLAYLVFFSFQKAYMDNKKITIKTITPFKVTVYTTLFLFAYLILYFIENKTGILIGTEYVSDRYNVFMAIRSFAGKLVLPYFSIFLLIFVVSSIGRKILEFFKFRFDSLLNLFLVSCGTGFFVLINFMFFIGEAKILTTKAVWSFFVFLIIISYRQAGLFIKEFFTYNFAFKSKFFSLKIILLFIIIFSLAINIAYLVFPLPTGWDSLNYYINLSKEISLRHSIVPGGQPYGWSFIMSLGFILFNSANIAMYYSFAGSLLSVLVVYAFANTFFGEKYGLISAVIFYTMPLTFHLSAFDMKIDLALFFMSFLSLFCFFKWRENKENKWIYLAGIFAGQSFSIKLTAAFLIAPLFVVLVFALATERKERFLESVKILVLTGVCILIPILPWISKNYVEQKKLHPMLLLEGKNNKAINIDYNKLNCSPSYREKEIGRYGTKKKGILKYVFTPWDLTMNTQVKGFYVMISFVYLIFLPFFILFFFRLVKDKTVFFLAVFLGFYLMFWINTGQGIPWYAITAFGAGAVLCETILRNIFFKTDINKYTALIVVLISVFSMVFFRVSEEADKKLHLKYRYGILNRHEAVDYLFGKYMEIDEYINTVKAKTPEDKNYIYIVGTYASYFITDSFNSAYSDGGLMLFECFSEHGNSKQIKENFKKFGFKFVIFNLYAAEIEKEREGPLHKKTQKFADFLNKEGTNIKNYGDFVFVELK